MFLVWGGGVLEFRLASEGQNGYSLAAVASEPMLEYGVELRGLFEGIIFFYWFENYAINIL